MEVLILGAGMAGLTAARALASSGVSVTVLEARDRVGGRIFSTAVRDGVTVELGAEFVHGRAPELWALLYECGAETTERDGSILRELRHNHIIEDLQTEQDDLFSPLTQLAQLSNDVSFAAWLQASEIPEHQRKALLGYVEGFNAADANRISARALGLQQVAENEIEGDLAWHVRGGYARLTDFLAHRFQDLGGTLRLNCTVRSVHWRPGKVRVHTSAGEFRASHCIVTLPLGVLQQAGPDAALRFYPEPAALSAARRLVMGNASRFTMTFQEPWWQNAPRLRPEALRTLSFLFTTERMPPVWWTSHPEPTLPPMLTGWAGGPSAAALAGQDPAELGRVACRTLAHVFDVPEPRILDALLSTHMHDWAADPFARGAYSYVPVGALDVPSAMAQPEAQTIFFAGEHTDITGHWGTVHAALRSGLRAAAQLLASE
jgi:monoamine oxidase